jgi:hypothetical protein
MQFKAVAQPSKARRYAQSGRREQSVQPLVMGMIWHAIPLSTATACGMCAHRRGKTTCSERILFTGASPTSAKCMALRRWMDGVQEQERVLRLLLCDHDFLNAPKTVMNLMVLHHEHHRHRSR